MQGNLDVSECLNENSNDLISTYQIMCVSPLVLVGTVCLKCTDLIEWNPELELWFFIVKLVTQIDQTSNHSSETQDRGWILKRLPHQLMVLTDNRISALKFRTKNSGSRKDWDIRKRISRDHQKRNLFITWLPLRQQKPLVTMNNSRKREASDVVLRVPQYLFNFSISKHFTTTFQPVDRSLSVVGDCVFLK